jgi:hypothetical protein
MDGVPAGMRARLQYAADVRPARMYREEFRRRGLAPQILSRAVEDSDTVTSPLAPEDECSRAPAEHLAKAWLMHTRPGDSTMRQPQGKVEVP